MPFDLRVVVPNRPGTLLATCDALADAGIELLGFCGDIRPGERWGFLHVLVEEPDAAQAALQAAGMEITSVHKVDVNDVEKHTGALADEIREYSDKGRNLEVLYLDTYGRIVVGTDDMLTERLGRRMGDT